MHLVPRATLDVPLALPPPIARAALRAMIGSPDPPALFRARDGLAGDEADGVLRLRVIPAAGSIALFEARVELTEVDGGARVRLHVGPRPGATSFFWSLGAIVVAAGLVLLAYGHAAGAVTACLPVLGWWGRFLGESTRLVRGVRRLQGERRRAVLER